MRIFIYVAFCYSMVAMKTNDEVRRLNLILAIRRVRTATILAEMVETAPAYLSQIKNSTPDSKTGKPKTMGDDVARRIEVAIREPLGWMDTPHDAELRETAEKGKVFKIHSDNQPDFVLPDVEQESRLGPRKAMITAIHPDDPHPEDVIYVPESRIEFSGGNGRTAQYELVEDEEPATYRLSWFQKYGINPDHVRRFRVSGDSMVPMLYPRDTILVNTEETNIIDGKMYAIRYGDELRVKYLSRRLDGTIILRSVNQAYKDEEVSPELAGEHITIIGRVRDTSGTGGL